MTKEQTLEERISYFKDDVQEAIKSFYAETLQEAVIESLEIIKELGEENRKLKEDKWQPIATAPKDGTEILVYISKYANKKEYWLSTHQVSRWLGDPRDDGWYLEGDGLDDPVYPDFWMPLPEFKPTKQ